MGVVAMLSLAFFAAPFQSGVNSFASTAIIFSVATLALLGTSQKLITLASISGVMTVIVTVPVFLAMFAVTPMYVNQT